jgi:outer membrane cobalamin receptor
LAGDDPTPENTPVREEILELHEEETEIGWRSDVNVLMRSGGILTAGALVSRADLEFERRLAGDWIRYVYDANDFRQDPAQRYIVLTPAGFDSRLSATATRIAAYTDYTWSIGDYSFTPGVRYDQDGFSDESMVSPRLMLNWRPDAATHVWIGGGVYYQAPRYLDLAADALNIGLQHERSTQAVAGVSRHLTNDLRFSAEAYHQRLDDLIVMADRTTGLASNIAKAPEAASISCCRSE